MTAHAPTDFTVTDASEALLQTVRQYPFDPLPRTIYADWLEENGQAITAKHVRRCRAQLDDLWRSDMADFLKYAQAVFSQYPMTAVRLKDKQAFASRQLPPLPINGPHYWHLGSGRAGLPPSIFSRLAWGDAIAGRVGYPTGNNADAALSRALVDHGRHAAGLRLIDWDTEGQS